MKTSSSSLPTPKISEQQIKNIAWERGLLTWKLFPYQHKLYTELSNAIKNPDTLKYTVNCSRRFGKSFILSLIAIEAALQAPNKQIRFATSTAVAMRKIIQPIFRNILEDCPKHLRPRYKAIDSVYIFPNGSEIHLSGCANGKYENLRGTASDLNIVDEAGFIDELDYIVHSVLMPQTLTTNGTTILISTPPSTPAHDFYSIAIDCKQSGNYSVFTIDDNTNVTQELKDSYARESGGYESTTYKREYMCQFVTNADSQIIPEWNDDYIVPVSTDQFYQYYYKYVSLDIGVKDFSAALLGYYDFKNATLYIQDEWTLNGHEMTTDIIADELSKKEEENFGDHRPHKRIADNNNLLLVNDLGIKHNMHFIPTSKSTLDAMINKVRIMVKEGRIVVDPKCEYLIANLKYGVWDKKGRQFARSMTYKHFDHLAALVYMVINIDTYTNPIPMLHNVNIHNQHVNPSMRNNGTAHALESLFGRR